MTCAATLETVGSTVSSGAGAERAYRGPLEGAQGRSPGDETAGNKDGGDRGEARLVIGASIVEVRSVDWLEQDTHIVSRDSNDHSVIRHRELQYHHIGY